MTCDCCEAAREAPAYTMHCPSCVHCGARLIQALGSLPRPKGEIVARRRAVLADWVTMGHSEQELRALAKGPRALAPASEPSASLAKPRKRGG